MFHILQAKTYFYQTPDFWIFFVIGGAGLLFSILSWLQAKAAKKAAQNAGRIVKIQDILLDIPEITNLCQQVDIKVDYNAASIQLTTIMGKIAKVIAIFNGDPNLSSNQQPIIQPIQGTIKEIQDILKSLNPVYFSEDDRPKRDIEGYVYLSIAPYTTILVTQLNSLMGILNSHMIQNK